MILRNRKRIIPVLTLKGDGLVKTVNFKAPKYVGDPINSVRIFNDKLVDEIVIFDIDASINNQGPNFELLERITGEAFMPMAYGGGIRSLEEARRLFYIGFEKIILNSVIFENQELVKKLVEKYGSSSILACIDINKGFLGRYECYALSGTRKKNISIVEYARKLERLGVGEIIINCIHREGTFKGYDEKVLKQILDVVDIPIIVCGGAANIDDVKKIIFETNAEGAAASSIFVFYGPHRAVLINYPDEKTLDSIYENF